MAKRPVKKPTVSTRAAVKKPAVGAPAKAPPALTPPSVAATAGAAAAIAPSLAAAIAPIGAPIVAPVVAATAATVAAAAQAAPTPVSAPSAEKPENTEPSLMSPLPTRLVELFRLSRLEQRAIYQLLASDVPMSVATLADRLELELVAAIALLAPEGTLRGRALVEAEARTGLGFLAPCDLLTIGRGLHLWCGESDKPPVDDALLFAAQAPGVTYFAAPLPGTSWAQDLVGDKRPPAVAEVVRDHLGAGQAVALWLSSTSQSDLMPLVQALRARLARPVVLVESAQLAGWPQPELCAALRRLRRDADLRGAAVVVSDVKQLGGAYRALCQPRPVGQTAPLILCGSDDKPPVGKLPQGASFETPLALAQASLQRSAAATAVATTAVDDTTDDPALLASREEARRRAAYDAARAMGRPLPPELSEHSKAAATVATTVPAPAAGVKPGPPSPIYKPPPPANYTPPPPAEEEPPPAAAARPINPRLAAALAKAGLPPAGSASYQAEPSTPRPGPPPAAAPAPQPPASAPPTSAAAAPPVEPAPVEPMPEDDQPPLPVEENAALDEVLRIIRTTPNNAQRIQMLRDLSGKRAPTVIQLFRSFTTSAHPGVRAAAEAGMASIFGANWNRSRAIAAPIQPPRSDDGGRGPGGAF